MHAVKTGRRKFLALVALIPVGTYAAACTQQDESQATQPKRAESDAERRARLEREMRQATQTQDIKR